MLYGRALMRLLAEPWDLVHCWEEPYVVAAAQLSRAVRRNVPLVFGTFQNIVKRYPPPFAWIQRTVLRRADGMIAYGETSRAVLKAHGWSQSTCTIPAGVDTARFAPDPSVRERIRYELGWAGDVPVIGFVGRFVPEKGVAQLASILDRLSTPWRALFLGSGPLETDLRVWSRKYGDRVRIQRASHDGVPDYLNAMDVLCAPSQTTPRWREQFGRMLIEAFACGVPVVASESGEIPHVVGETGVIVPEADIDAWVEAIGALVADPGRRLDLSRRGRERAVAVYAWPVIARRHLDFFDEVIG